MERLQQAVAAAEARGDPEALALEQAETQQQQCAEAMAEAVARQHEVAEMAAEHEVEHEVEDENRGDLGCDLDECNVTQLLEDSQPSPKPEGKDGKYSGEQLAEMHPELAGSISEVLLALPGVGRNMLRMHVAPEHPEVYQMSSSEVDALTNFVRSQMGDELDALCARDQQRSLSEVGLAAEELCQIEDQISELLQQAGQTTSVRPGHSMVSWDGSTRCEGLHVRVTYDRCSEGREDESGTCVFYVKRPHQYDWVNDQESQGWQIEPIKYGVSCEASSP